jgi:hypothetical protein
MPKNNNSAYRAHEILLAACDFTGQETMLQVFAKVFSFPDTRGRKLSFEVARMMGLFISEIESAEAKMKAGGFSTDLYETCFTTITQRITLQSMFSPWADHREYIKTALLPLKFCSEVLPHEEKLIGEDELKSIEKGLQDLEALLHKSELSDTAKAFIRHHISLIRKAIRDYQIIGAGAFRTAVYEGFADYLRHEDIVLENHDKQEFTMLGKAWTGVKRVANLTVKAEKLLTAGTKLYELGEKAVDHIDKLT